MIYFDADVDYCRSNDKYGLYKKADEGDLKYMPGIDMDFDKPENPDLVIDPSKNKNNLQDLIDLLLNEKIFPLE